MSYVITPLGIIMHVDNHRAAVKVASKAQLMMLEPAKPYDHTKAFAGIDQAKANK